MNAFGMKGRFLESEASSHAPCFAVLCRALLVDCADPLCFLVDSAGHLGHHVLMLHAVRPLTQLALHLQQQSREKDPNPVWGNLL